MPDDIWSLTPEQVGERLAAMAPAAPAVDLAKQVNISAMSPAQARERRDALLQNLEFQKKFLEANGVQLREYRELSEKAAEAGDRLEAVLTHGAEAEPLIPEVTFDGALNSAKLRKVITDLRS